MDWGVIGNTFKRKKSRETKLILKRNEFLQYSTRHIEELETAMEYFREGFENKFSIRMFVTKKNIYIYKYK